MPRPLETDLTGHAFGLPASCSLEMGQKDENAEVHDASSADHKSCVGTQVEPVMAEIEMDTSQGTTLVMGGEVEKDSDAASSSQQEIDDEDESMTSEELQQVALKLYEVAFVAGAQWMKRRLSLEESTALSQDDIARMARICGNHDIIMMIRGFDPTRPSDE